MRRVDVVVMNDELRVGSSGLSDRMSESLTLQQVEIESGGQHEDLSWAVARDCGRQGVDGNQLHGRTETENRLAGRDYRTRVPAADFGSQICSQDERGSQCSLPPIRPCLVMEASTSTIARTATSAVMSEISYGGDTSTASIAATPSFATPFKIASASRGRNPPGSGQPVPGTKPASMESTSKDRYTADAPFHATSSAISTVLSIPMRSMSLMVRTVEPRSRPFFTPGRGTCHPPIPTCTKLVGGQFGILVA